MKTKLYDKHLNLQAKMVDFAGWEMPIQYQNLKEEVLAVRNNAGVFDVSHMGEFFVTGPQTEEYIDFLITNDFKSLKVNKAIYSPLCNNEGGVVDDLIAYKLDKTKALICVNAANIDKDYKYIEKYSKDFNVKLENMSQEYSLIALQGPNSYTQLKKIEHFSTLPDIEYYSAIEFGEFIIARTGYTGEDGFEIFAPNNIIEDLWDNVISLDVKPCGLGARDVLRLEACFPLYGNELNDTTSPLDSGLKWTVKEEKDSFLGKESIFSNKRQKKLIKFSLEKGIPRAGYKLLDESGAVIGEVTSGTMSVMLNKGIGLGLVDFNFQTKEMPLYIDIRNKKIKATTQMKAFYRGGNK